MAFERISAGPESSTRASLRWAAWMNVAIAVVASASVVAVACHLPWPQPADSALIGTGATVLLIGSAIASAVVVILTVCQRRPWTWASVVWPVMVGCAVGVAALGRPHFDDSRHEFEEIGRQLLHEPEGTRSDRYRRDLRIGRFDIAYAHVDSAGAVYFYDARDGLSPRDNPGWVYAPAGVSERTIARVGLRRISDKWYEFSNLVVDDY